MRNYWFPAIVTVLFLVSGCAVSQKKTAVGGKESTVVVRGGEKVVKPLPMEVQVRQAQAVAETALEVSRKAEFSSQEAVNTSNQANATADSALQTANKATEEINATKAFAQEQAEKAITASNEAADRAIAASDKAQNVALESSEKAINAANEAITKANDSADRAIAASNQAIAESNRTRATIKMAPPEEPILQEEPAYRTEERTYTTRRGDTLSKLAARFYSDSSKWKLIYEKNRNVIKGGPSSMRTGIKIVIP